ncbi:alkaline phosphatase, tissue-nonspecific isozyme-like [Glandiceps talaboti]
MDHSLEKRWLFIGLVISCINAISTMEIKLFLLTRVLLSTAPADWNQMASEELQRMLELEKLNTNTAKNVIVFLGDGMGVATVTSARIYKGQQEGKNGEEGYLAFEKLPRTALIKTYTVDYQVPDSAGTATAILCGIKTNSIVLGVDSSVQAGNCSSQAGAEVDSVFKLAVQAGKSAGFVTTARITHASPAAGYAVSAHRNWESSTQGNCKDIASQLIESTADWQVLLGGGRMSFLPNTTSDPEHATKYGLRYDGRDLTEEWKNNIPSGLPGQYVWKKDDFDAVDPENTDYLLGLFEYSHMQYEANRAADVAGEPSLSEMTEKAIRILSKNVEGFFLFVEGGRIDHAHHETRAYGALTDAIAFDEAVARALELVDTEDTLVIVTADHSHVNTISGYPDRGNPILGTSSSNTEDGLPYTTVSYANGPSGIKVVRSYEETGMRPNITGVDTAAADYLQESLVPMAYETHAGDDVAIYADGPYSHLFQSVHEQHYIAHVIKYASKLGEYENRPTSGSTRTGSCVILTQLLVCVLLLFI